MQNEQQTLHDFLDLYGQPTLRSIAQISGLNTSRIFRILHGAKMRYEEYSIFQNLVSQKREKVSTGLMADVVQELECLDSDSLHELWLYIQRYSERKKILANGF